MAKKLIGSVKLQLPAGRATGGPWVGSIAQYGINTMEFIKSFNARTQSQEGMIVPVVVSIYSDRSFTFEVKTPPVSALLKAAAGIAIGSGRPNTEKVATLPLSKIREIAQQKLPDLNTTDLEAAVRIVLGTAKSMGIEVVEG